MAASPDGDIVAMTTNSGLVVVDAISHALLASFEGGSVYTKVQVSQLSSNVYMLAVITKSGKFSQDPFYSIIHDFDHELCCSMYTFFSSSIKIFLYEF